MENQHFYEVNKAFLWPCSIANCKRLPEGKLLRSSPVTMDVSLDVCGTYTSSTNIGGLKLGQKHGHDAMPGPNKSWALISHSHDIFP